ncbi:helix-turn-helix domain-containing protein [Aureisphaera sp.]
MKYSCLIFFLFVLSNSYGQDFNQSYLDQLQDEELLTLFDDFENDTLKQETIARTYLERGRREGDTIKMARAYDRMSFIFHTERNIAMADSVILLTKDLEHITYPAQGYLTRGFLKDGDRYDPYSSFKDYLTAYEIAKARGNVPQQTYLMDRLVFLQGEWGDSEKALELQKKRHKLMQEDHLAQVIKSTRKSKRDNVKNYQLKDEITSFQCFVFCYLNLKKLDSARIYLQKSKEKVKEYEGYDKFRDIAWGLDAQMEIEYYSGNYGKVLALGDSIVNQKSYNVSHYYLKNTNLFKGLAYNEMKEFDKALAHLLIADSLFHGEKVLSLIQSDRLLNKGLFETYKAKGNTEKQIEYLDRIIGLDSIIKKNYLAFQPRHIREFETPLLLEEKQALIDALEKREQRNQALFWGVGVLLVLSLGLVAYYYNRQRIFRMRFEALVNNTEAKKAPKPLEAVNPAPEISPEVIDMITKGLKKFESNKGFLNAKVNLNTLAKKMDTNSSYLSRVVNFKIGKGFSQYVSDLRLEYAMKELLSQELYRKFTIKAIAQECGFKNAESFSRGFYKKYGIYPSYYIKKFEKKKEA